MSERILVVGGAGYVGGYLTDVLTEDGYAVTVYDNLLYEDRYFKDVNLIVGDVCDYDKLDPILEDYDTVVWLAAVVGDQACDIDPLITKEVNVDSVRHLAEVFNGRIVYPSTCSVYGAQDEELTEESPTKPLSVYAQTKLEAEEILAAKDAIIFRLGTLYGMGDMWSRIRMDLVVNLFTAKAFQKEPLIINGGEQWRPLLHVRDVAHAVSHALVQWRPGTYNIASYNIQIKDLAQIYREIDHSVELFFREGVTRDLRNYRVNTDKMYKWDFDPIGNIEYGIKQLLDVFLSGRVKNPNDPIYHNYRYLRGRT
jgi:nucleoside-diphosphate-sugar epimerase